jgi:hypothetical protein
MNAIVRHFMTIMLGSVRDIAPIVLLVLFFQVVVLGQPLSELGNLFSGLIMVLIGLAMFVFGLELGLFPIGENMARSLAKKGSLFWLVIFAFVLGFGTTAAEPALIAVAKEASDVAAVGGMIVNEVETKASYALGLRFTVALAVGLAIVIGVLRILKGWSFRWIIIGGYVLVVIMTQLAPVEIIGVAYDAGGVTTSTITVPLVTALGVGLARAIKGRNPMLDGFGIIAFASLTPMVFVMGYGMVV